ncbi:hypothetical protein [Streptococcus sobrinus]|uniref:hypothetical protein n=1 Tax=Streptococcus sobrinus TaxID=1310 RepID=UPI00031DDB02|nr:hypothetical protein [Streptococcus sobrinus]
MIDTAKVKFFKVVGTIFGVIIIFLIGFGFGQINKPENHAKSTKKVEHVKSDIITEKMVKDFLIAYYTKSDLGENRDRYKEYMTTSLYNTTVTNENGAEEQAYKGYHVNYVFDEAKIYIDQKNNIVIADISYTNDELKKKDSKEDASEDVKHEVTMKLTYSEINGEFKVSAMSPVYISDGPTEETEDDTTTEASSTEQTANSSTSKSEGE